MIRFEGAYGVSGEKAGGSQCSDVTSTFDNIDGVDIVGIDATSTAETSHELSEDIDRYFAPWEVTEGGESDSNSRVDVSSRHATRHPNTECCA